MFDGREGGLRLSELADVVFVFVPGTVARVEHLVVLRVIDVKLIRANSYNWS
jgi:hypothetical protein